MKLSQEAQDRLAKFNKAESLVLQAKQAGFIGGGAAMAKEAKQIIEDEAPAIIKDLIILIDVLKQEHAHGQ